MPSILSIRFASAALHAVEMLTEVTTEAIKRQRQGQVDGGISVSEPFRLYRLCGERTCSCRRLLRI